jgi:anthranilate phosphoribosyltransferase
VCSSDLPGGAALAELGRRGATRPAPAHLFKIPRFDPLRGPPVPFVLHALADGRRVGWLAQELRTVVACKAQRSATTVAARSQDRMSDRKGSGKEDRRAMNPIVEELLRTPFDPGQKFFAQVQRRITAAYAKQGPRESIIDRCIEKLCENEELSDDDAREAFRAILKGDLAEDQIGSLLVLLDPARLPAHTIAAFADVVHANAKKVEWRGAHGHEILGDTCGTGGDSRGTFNVSTTIMFILAAGGVKIAKHGNRAFTSRCGSADVLEALGVRIDLEPEDVAACIDEVNVGFMFAPRFHESFKNVQTIRKKLAEDMPPVLRKKTIFNVLGPLANPASANCQIIGVFDRALTSKFAEVLRQRGVKRALVPYGLPVSDGDKGFDEFSTAGTTVYAELRGDNVLQKQLEPEDAGLARVRDADLLTGGDKDQNAAILRGILEGKETPERTDFALLNAGAGFYVAEKARTIGEGVALARDVLKSGAAAKTLSDLCELSKKLADARG